MTRHIKTRQSTKFPGLTVTFETIHGELALTFKLCSRQVTFWITKHGADLSPHGHTMHPQVFRHCKAFAEAVADAASDRAAA